MTVVALANDTSFLTEQDIERVGYKVCYMLTIGSKESLSILVGA